MSQHRTWDENRSPQWKYLFQKESARKRKTRRDLDKEIRDNIKEENEEYNKTIKFGQTPLRTTGKKRRKVSKEQLKAKLEATNNEIKKLIMSRKPEYIVNFAAQGMVAESWLNPEHWYQTNVVSQVKLHDEIRKVDCIKKYVHISTPEAYGSTDGGWLKENYNFSPSTPYAVSRAACDLHLLSFYKAYSFPVVFTRAANVYGPAQQLYRIIPRTMLSARLGRKLNLHGGGISVRSFIHMEDVSSATYKISLQGNIGETYHISTKQTNI